MRGSPRDRLSETSVSVNVLAIVMTLLGSVASAPAQNFGMEQGTTYFTIDWERGQHRGKPSVRGYIANHWGLAATDLRCCRSRHLHNHRPDSRRRGTRLSGLLRGPGATGAELPSVGRDVHLGRRRRWRGWGWWWRRRGRRHVAGLRPRHATSRLR